MVWVGFAHPTRRGAHHRRRKRGAAHMGVALGSGKAIKGDAYGVEREPTFHFWNVGLG